MTESATLEIESFSHVSVGVSDIERSLDFYRRIFGAEIVFDVGLEGESLETVTSTEGAKGRMIGLLIGGAVIELLGLGTRVEIVEFPAVARTPVELWRGRADA